MNNTFPNASAPESFRGLVDIGERRLFAEVAGTGIPTVVLEAGRGDWSDTWEPIWADLVALTRVVRYDRAGLGRSDPVVLPRTCADLVLDLHRLLQLVAQPGPYILVGHSIGGLTIRLYAHHYPHEIVGMVFVDPTHHDSFARERAVLPPESPLDSVTLREMREQLNQPPIPSGDDMIDTLSCQEQARHCGSLGNMPLIVLTGMRRRRFADIPDELIAGFYALKWVDSFVCLDLCKLLILPNRHTLLLIDIAPFRKTLVVPAATRLKRAIEQACLWLAREEAVCEGLQHWASLQRTHVLELNYSPL